MEEISVKKTILKEKDKMTIEITKKVPTDNKIVGTKVIQTKDSITLQKL